MGQTSMTLKAGLCPAADSTWGSAMKSKAPDSLIDLRAFHMTPLKLENSALGATSTTISLDELVGR